MALDCNLQSDSLNQSPAFLITLQCGMPWPEGHLLVELQIATGICLWSRGVVAGKSAGSWKSLAQVSGSMLMLGMKAHFSSIQISVTASF